MVDLFVVSWQRQSVDTLAERLVYAMDARGIHLRELHRLSGVNVASLSRAINDNRKVNIENLTAIAKALNVRAEWLANGEGSMADDVDAVEDPISAAIRFAKALGVDAATIDEYMRELERGGERLEPRRLVDALVARYDANRFAARNVAEEKPKRTLTGPKLPTIDDIRQKRRK